MKSTEQKEAERQARIAAAEAKDRTSQVAAKGEKPEKKGKAEAAAGEAERPKRGRRKEGPPERGACARQEGAPPIGDHRLILEVPDHVTLRGRGPDPARAVHSQIGA